ncbi:hypothetical protein T459_18734 [Capsicum annuum]|uniref:Uncharacterized protein n=1 Tax=Capsicum annuum TaxID=4072 RepID=A0A2G2YZM5_CAPAN|nr:hypothetical protein T459_18734 [Capsicum annuum]
MATNFLYAIESCTTTRQFTKTRENDLLKFWQLLREKQQPGVDWSLWIHEWRVHGVCGGAATTAGAIVYFDTAIKINAMIRKGNLFNYLKTNGIIACDSLAFTRKEIFDAILSPPPPPPHAPPPPRAPPPPPPPPPPPNLNVYLSCWLALTSSHALNNVLLE